MKRFNIFATMALAMVLGLGAAIGIGSGTKEVRSAEATENATYTGSIAIEFNNGSGGWYWDNDSAKVAFYVHEYDGGPEVGWSSMISTTAGTHRYEIPYSFSKSPMGCKLILMRYPTGHSDTPDWDNSNWGRINGLDFGSVVYCNGKSASIQVTSYPFIGCNSLGWELNDNNALRYAKFSGDNVELYGNITLSQGDYFKFLYVNGGNTYNKLADGIDPTYIKGSPYSPYNIDCFYRGTYTFYVKHNYDNKEMWITIPDEAYAEHWGDTFLKTITCTGTSPGAVTFEDDAWNKTMRDAYLALTTNQQGKVWTASANLTGTYLERAVYRYDFILSKYGDSKYDNFVNRKISKLDRITLLGSVMDPKTTGTVAIVVISSLVAIGAFAGYFFYKKKKEDR